MSRPTGALNKRTSQTLQEYGELCDKYSFSPLDLLFQCAKGKIKGIKGKIPIEMRLTAAKELLPYGHAKLSTVHHQVKTDDEISITWQNDLFLENPTHKELLSDAIDAL